MYVTLLLYYIVLAVSVAHNLVVESPPRTTPKWGRLVPTPLSRLPWFVTRAPCDNNQHNKTKSSVFDPWVQACESPAAINASPLPLVLQRAPRWTGSSVRCPFTAPHHATCPWCGMSHVGPLATELHARAAQPVRRPFAALHSIAVAGSALHIYTTHGRAPGPVGHAFDLGAAVAPPRS